MYARCKYNDFSLLPRILPDILGIKQKKATQMSGFAVRTGLEPVTPCVTGMYSNQLN